MTKQEWLKQEVEKLEKQHLSYFCFHENILEYNLDGMFTIDELKKLIEIAEQYKEME